MSGERDLDDVERIFREERVDPLSPEPGTYERIVTEARRRRRRSSGGRWVAAAAAVVVAGGAGVAYGVLNGDDPGDSTITPAQTSSSSVSSPTNSGPTGPSGSTTSPSDSISTTAPAATPIPADFSPVDVSTAARGKLYVLGTTACASGSCGISLATTGDDGASWHGVPTPQGLGWTTQVREVRFAGQDAWLAGDELWATHDGGQTWQQVDVAGQQVLTLESDGSSVYAVVGDCAKPASDGTRTCQTPRVLSATNGSDDFHQVDGFGLPDKVVSARLLFGAGGVGTITVGAGAQQQVWWRPAADASWKPLPANPCPGGSGNGSDLSGRTPTAVLPAAGQRILVAFCGDPAAGNVAYTVRESTDGTTWDTTGQRLRIGNGDTTFAAATGAELAVTMDSPDLGQAFEVSHDHGATWTDAGRAAAVPQTKPQSVVAAGSRRYFVTSQAPVLWVSDDAGRTWSGWSFHNGQVTRAQ